MIIRYPISGDRRFGDLQRIALILVRVTSVHLLTQALYKKTVDAVTPSTGPITMKSAVEVWCARRRRARSLRRCGCGCSAASGFRGLQDHRHRSVAAQEGGHPRQA